MYNVFLFIFLKKNKIYKPSEIRTQMHPFEIVNMLIINVFNFFPERGKTNYFLVAFPTRFPRPSVVKVLKGTLFKTFLCIQIKTQIGFYKVFS